MPPKGVTRSSWVNNRERLFSKQRHIELPTIQVYGKGVRIFAGVERLEDAVSSAVDHCDVVAMRVRDIDPIRFRIHCDPLRAASNFHGCDYRASCTVNHRYSVISMIHDAYRVGHRIDSNGTRDRTRGNRGYNSRSLLDHRQLRASGSRHVKRPRLLIQRHGPSMEAYGNFPYN